MPSLLILSSSISSFLVPFLFVVRFVIATVASVVVWCAPVQQFQDEHCLSFFLFDGRMTKSITQTETKININMCLHGLLTVATPHQQQKDREETDSKKCEEAGEGGKAEVGGEERGRVAAIT